MVYDEYTKLRILGWYQQGIRAPTIHKLLKGKYQIYERGRCKVFKEISHNWLAETFFLLVYGSGYRSRHHFKTTW